MAMTTAMTMAMIGVALPMLLGQNTHEHQPISTPIQPKPKYPSPATDSTQAPTDSSHSSTTETPTTTEIETQTTEEGETTKTQNRSQTQSPS